MKVMVAAKSSQFLYLSHMRAQDARSLLKNARYVASVYLAGYSIECAFKAVLAKRRHRDELAEEHQHHDLVRLAAAVVPFLSQEDARDIQSVPAWSHLFRYSCSQTAAVTAIKFLERAEEIRRCLQTYSS